MPDSPAANLQKKHELDGAPDPFPSLNDTPAKPRPSTLQPQVQVDTASQDAFPSLAQSSPASATAAKSSWGAGPRIKASVSKQPVASDTFTLTDIDLSSAGKDGRPATLGEIMRTVMAKYKIKVEASSNRGARQTTFHLKADSQKDLAKARRDLLSALSPVVTLVIHAPASTIGTIIGQKGATLKQIRDQTNVRVDIPPRDTLAPTANGHATTASSGNGTPVLADDDEEPTIPVTLSGPQPMVQEALETLNRIIASKTSRATQRVRDIPANVFPFVMASRGVFLAAAAGGDIQLSRNEAEREITVSGDRETVVRVVDSIKGTVETFKTSITSVKISLPKRQHRLLVGKAVDEIMGKSNCSVVVAPAEDSSDEVIVWGKGEHLPAGLQTVMEKANSEYIHEFPLPGPITLSKQLLRYMTCIDYPTTLSAAHPGASVYTPHAAIVEKAQVLNVDIVGPKPIVDAVVRQVSELIGKLIGATTEIDIDWLIHRVITGKHAKKLKQFHEVHNVLVFFPPESAEQSTVLLVYDPSSPSASPSPVEKERHLEEVSKDLLKLAKDAADVKSEVLTVESRWHEAVKGQGGTTLNAIIGEDKTLSIKLGAEAGDPSTQDVILIRGPSSDVDSAVKRIHQIVEDAKNDEIVNSYSTEFDIDREYVGRIVGAHGTGVNKLRDQLGVRVDVSDDVDDKEMIVGKKKKIVHQKSRVKITGRKENVEDAKKRILTQIERLADETSEVLKIPSQYHSSLIGQSGKYAIRLEEKYSVKITFPRQFAENGEGRTREQLKADEVLVKGGKKGVAGAKAELLEALDFEKESNNILKFTVPTRSIARILGKGGVTINEIKDDTDAQIDVDKTDDLSTNISVRGTKTAISAAKAAILAIADQLGEEAMASVTVESKFHRAIIGAGGQGLKELISRCGGPSDSKLQAGLIRFPRQGEPSDEVRLRGEPKLVDRIKVELEKTVATLRDRVILAVDIPVAQHRALIGRGGQHLNDLQTRHGVQVQFPGSRSYNYVGEAMNAAEFSDVEAINIVKVSGPTAAVEQAIDDLKSQLKPPTPEGITATVSVPLKYHHVISQQGNFFRTLRSFGVHVDQSVHPTKSAVPTRPESVSEATSARIDDAQDENATEIQWQVTPNYTDAEEGDSEWTLKARDLAGLERAQQLIKDAVANAESMSHVGFLTLADRFAFPRIVGTKGANVSRLRVETGADITVSRENSTIVIIGSESAILLAKDAIINIAASPGRPTR